DHSPQYQARSLRAVRSRGGRLEIPGLRSRRISQPVHRLYVRLEHAAHRSAAVGEGTFVLQGIPTAAGTGDLQFGGHPEASSGGERAPERIAEVRGKIRRTGAFERLPENRANRRGDAPVRLLDSRDAKE